jgi:hypothetical protein
LRPSASVQFFEIEPTETTFEPFPWSQFCGSEANSVINNYNGLKPSQQQDILNFLRSR